MQRVMIVGGPGSGKSTLARALGEAMRLPVHHMDHIHWMPGWQQRPRDERREMATEIEMGEAWIFEGSFSTTYAQRLSRYWGQERPDMAPGCREGIHGETWAFYVWIWTTRASARAKLAALFATAPAHVQVHHLTSRKMVRRFLEGVAC